MYAINKFNWKRMIRKSGDQVLKLGLKKALIVTDEVLFKIGVVKKLIDV